MSDAPDPETPNRLAVAIPSLDGGGAERVAVNLLHGFVGAGLEVDLLLVRPRGPLLEEVPPEIRVVPLRGGRIIATIPSLVGYLRRARPDALLSHLDTMNLVTLWARDIARVSPRLVVTTHVALSQHAAAGSIRQAMTARLIEWWYRRADVVVGVSRGVAGDLERRIGPGHVPIRAIHNPVVSAEQVRRAERLRGAWGGAGEALSVPAGARLVLSVGRLTPQKNQRLLIDAFARVSGDDTDLHLAILGEGRLRSDLMGRIRELGLADRVSLPGFVNDPAPWYAAAELFVLSSNWEGLPTVLIEALLHGCPVVSTRCPSGPEEILEEGRYGRLVPMNDADAMARAMREALAEPADPEPLRRRALDFGHERAVRRYLDVLFPGGAG